MTAVDKFALSLVVVLALIATPGIAALIILLNHYA